MPLGADQNITSLARYSDDTIVGGPGHATRKFWILGLWNACRDAWILIGFMQNYF